MQPFKTVPFLIGVMSFVLLTGLTPSGKVMLSSEENALQIAEREFNGSWTKCGRTYVTKIVRTYGAGSSTQSQEVTVYQIGPVSPLEIWKYQVSLADRKTLGLLEVYVVNRSTQWIRSWDEFDKQWREWTRALDLEQRNWISIFYTRIEFFRDRPPLPHTQFILPYTEKLQKPACSEIPKG